MSNQLPQREAFTGPLIGDYAAPVEVIEAFLGPIRGWANSETSPGRDAPSLASGSHHYQQGS